MLLGVVLGLGFLAVPSDGHCEDRSDQQKDEEDEDRPSPRLEQEGESLPHLGPVEGFDVSVGVFAAVVVAISPPDRVGDHVGCEAGHYEAEPDDACRAEVGPPHLLAFCLARLLVRRRRFGFLARAFAQLVRELLLFFGDDFFISGGHVFLLSPKGQSPVWRGPDGRDGMTAYYRKTVGCPSVP